MEGKNTDGICKDAEKLVEFISFSLYLHFACFAHRVIDEEWRELTKQSFDFCLSLSLIFLKLDCI